MKFKTDNAYKSIGEVAKKLDLVNKKTGKLNTHTIRFWEKEFKQIKPKLFSGNRRYYDKKAIDILLKIKILLKDKGFTIKGVKKYLINENSLSLDETINNSINTSKNKKVKIAKFGTFTIREKKSRIGRNPKTKENKLISERNVVLFRPSKELKKRINLSNEI